MMQFSLDLLPTFALVMFWLSGVFVCLYTWNSFTDDTNDSVLAAIGSLTVMVLSGILLALMH